MSQSESRRVAHCMYVEIELKKKNNLILTVWFYENSVKLRQSPTHTCVKATKVAHRGGPAKPGKWRIVSRKLIAD